MENNNTHEKDKIKDILDKIKRNEVTMRPKTYFIVRLVALILVALAIYVITIFLSSLVLFTIRASGHASLIGFGPSGWEVFLLLFPWKLLILDILLIILLEWLLRSFRFGYRIPVLYLFLGVVCLMVVSGYVLDRLHLHDDLMILYGQHRLPQSFGRIYDPTNRIPPPPFGRGIFRATVISIDGNMFRVELDDPRKSTTTTLDVFVQNSQILSSLSIGDRIFIAGKIIDGRIEARDIKKGPAVYGTQLK
jgi:hypothetical protein